jgi:polyhydroxybutyrate depolymerase
MEVDGRARSYLLHVPRSLTRPAPLIIALHGAAMTSSMMPAFTGLNELASREGVVVVYPDGTGFPRTWNAGPRWGRGKPDDVKFLSKLIDEVAGLTSIDRARVYACGMSNGGMMCYRLANELSDRIAAVGCVAGAMAVPKAAPSRPVPLLHIHCRGDTIVPYEAATSARAALGFKAIPEGARLWAEAIGCDLKPVDEVVPAADGSSARVTRRSWKGEKGQEVVLLTIDGGGHVWPGQRFPLGLQPTVKALSTNDALWELFKRHRLPAAP